MTDQSQSSIRFRLEGMTCASCVARAERVLTAQPGVAAARVNLADESAEVVFAAPATRESLADALERAGYPPRIETLTLAVEGMTCAACTGRVERVLAAQPGVIEARANLAQRRAQVSAYSGTDAARLAAAVSRAGFAAAPLAEANPDARVAELARLKRDAILAGLLALPIFVVEMGGHLIPAFHHWLMAQVPMLWLWAGQWLLATLALAGPGRRFFTKGIPALLRGGPDMNSLVAIGTAAAWIWSSIVMIAPDLVPPASRAVYFEAAAVIVALILAGRWMEGRARGQAGAAIERLLQLQPATALVETGEGWAEAPIAALRPGQRLRIRPGERVALDGVIEEGRSAIDESMLTGEALPVSKGPGDAVTGGTVNGPGGLVMRITAVGGDTVLSRIVAMVEQAQGAKLPVQALVDRITLWFVPAVLAVAALTVALWLAFGPDLAHALVAGVSVLIIACPCAMGLATPVSIMVGTGRAAELGVFFRRGEALQSLAEVRLVGFDKTGTLTEGKPALVAMEPASDHLLRLAAAVEAGSEHPLAHAVTKAAAERGLVLPDAQDFSAVPGQGALATIEGHRVAIGSARMMPAEIPPHLARQAESWAASGITPVYLAADGKVLGALGIADRIKPQSAPALAALHDLGVGTAMVTGDTEAVARAVAAELGIDEIRAGVLPAGKVEAVTDLGRAGPVAFVGDGINDAPALAAARVGIALGSGTDIAIEAAEVVLTGGDPGGVATAIALSRATLKNIRQNLIWAFGYNVALIPVAAGALVPFGGPQLSPMLAAGAMAASSIFVLTNALRLRRVAPAVPPAARS